MSYMCSGINYEDLVNERYKGPGELGFPIVYDHEEEAGSPAGVEPKLFIVGSYEISRNGLTPVLRVR